MHSLSLSLSLLAKAINEFALATTNYIIGVVVDYDLKEFDELDKRMYAAAYMNMKALRASSNMKDYTYREKNKEEVSRAWQIKRS